MEQLILISAIKNNKEYIEQNNILYHVTSIDNLEDVKTHGLIPQFGKNIRETYSDYYNFDIQRSYEVGDYDDENEKIYLDFDGILFFSEKPGLWYSDLKSGYKIKWNNILLCVVKKNEDIYKYIGTDSKGYYEFRDINNKTAEYIKGTDMIGQYEKPLFIETNDWFSIESQEVEKILYGQELEEYMKKHFIEEYNRVNK